MNLAEAEKLTDLGLFVVPIPFKKKGPDDLPGWPQLRLTKADLPRYFNNGRVINGGVINGDEYGSADVDLDILEAVRAAPAFLPETRLVWGRKSKRRSHYLYRADPPVKTRKYLDPLDKRVTICELRCRKADGSIGLQTMAPGSTHPDVDEVVEFEPGCDGHPANVDADVLVPAVGRVATAALLAKHWPAKGRHDCELALAGALARAGWSLEDAKTFTLATYRAVSSHDHGAYERVSRSVEDTFRKHSAGDATTGKTSLSDHIDPRVVKAALDWLGIRPGPAPESKPAGSVSTAGNFPLTEIGLAERLVQQFGADLRYCHQNNTWHVFNGRSWPEDDTAEVQRRAKSTIRDLYESAAKELDPERRQAIAKFAIKSDGDVTIRRVLSRAAAEAGIPVRLSDFDRDPCALNCANGVIDLRAGTIAPHSRELLMRNYTGVEYHAGARSAVWERFLADVTDGDRDLAGFLQVAGGYSATGDTSEEKLLMPIGRGGSGKSTLLEAIKSALGTYAWVADFESFLHRPAGGGGIRSDIAELAGKRFVLSVEVDEGARLAEGLVKHLTGGDTMRARQLYQEGFLFQPQFKLWLAANHAPKARDDDSGLWRRILRIPLDAVVPEARRDPSLKGRLKTDPECQQAILAWLVEGAIRWAEEGLHVPACIRQATEAYREDQDPLKEFFADACEFDPAAWVTAAQLRQAYERHCELEGIRYTLGPKQFGERLRARNCTSRTPRVEGKPTRIWDGIRLVQ